MIDKFIIFGHGKRVRENIIPALKIINPDINYKTYTKSGKYLDGYVYRETKKFKEFKLQEDFKNYIISVPPNNTLECLKKINTLVNRDDINIFIDTPVHKNLNSFKKINNICVLEDIKFLPWLKYFQENNLDIESVILNRCGYEYHGVALAKQLINEKIVNSKRSYRKNLTKTAIKFKNQKYVEIISPRNYLNGFIKVKSINNKEIIIGNKEISKSFNSSNVIFLEEIMDFSNDLLFKNLLSINPELKFDPSNFIASMEIFKVIGLSNLIKKFVDENYINTSINQSFEEQHIANKNKNLIRFKKILNL